MDANTKEVLLAALNTLSSVIIFIASVAFGQHISTVKKMNQEIKDREESAKNGTS